MPEIISLTFVVASSTAKGFCRRRYGNGQSKAWLQEIHANGSAMEENVWKLASILCRWTLRGWQIEKLRVASLIFAYSIIRWMILLGSSHSLSEFSSLFHIVLFIYFNSLRHLKEKFIFDVRFIGRRHLLIFCQEELISDGNLSNLFLRSFWTKSKQAREYLFALQGGQINTKKREE